MIAAKLYRGADTLADLAEAVNRAHEAGEAATLSSLQHYREAGEALIKARTLCGRKWLTWLKTNVTFSKSTAYNYITLAEQWDKVPTGVGSLRDAVRLLVDDPKPHVAHNSGEQEWYTPPEYIEAARQVLGSIGLDPASSSFAQQTVQADRYFTIEDDGLTQPWSGRVWLNPPYAAELVGKFTHKLCEHVLSGDVPAALLLTNNATETLWFQQALQSCSAICFPRKRLRFVDQDGDSGTPLQGQAVFYFGPDTGRFAEVFSSFGGCLRK
jgi:ParB family chromosome partitioning protein